MRPWLVLLACLALASCVSTQMKTFVGQSVQEAQIAYGPPVQVIEMPDGRRAYQFRYGGGAIPVPGYSTTTASMVGSTVVSTTTGMPGGYIESSGCLLTFLARQSSGVWIIDEIRVPKGLVC